jgi:hypothetical protein
MYTLKGNIFILVYFYISTYHVKGRHCHCPVLFLSIVIGHLLFIITTTENPTSERYAIISGKVVCASQCCNHELPGVSPDVSDG